MSQQRSSFIQIFDVFSRGHDSITHARRASCLAHVGSLFNDSCHCHLSWSSDETVAISTSAFGT